MAKTDEINDHQKCTCGLAVNAPTRPAIPLAVRIQPSSTVVATPANIGKAIAARPSSTSSPPSAKRTFDAALVGPCCPNWREVTVIDCSLEVAREETRGPGFQRVTEKWVATGWKSRFRRRA